jgi:hypothetical protein
VERLEAEDLAERHRAKRQLALLSEDPEGELRAPAAVPGEAFGG